MNDNTMRMRKMASGRFSRMEGGDLKRYLPGDDLWLSAAEEAKLAGMLAPLASPVAPTKEELLNEADKITTAAQAAQLMDSPSASLDEVVEVAEQAAASAPTPQRFAEADWDKAIEAAHSATSVKALDEYEIAERQVRHRRSVLDAIAMRRRVIQMSRLAE